MLKNIQIKIILIFLIVGVVIIGAMGYINYANLQKVIEITNDTAQIILLNDYQGNIKLVTIITMLVFIAICILARSFCNTKNNNSNNNTYKQCKKNGIWRRARNKFNRKQRKTK